MIISYLSAIKAGDTCQTPKDKIEFTTKKTSPIVAHQPATRL